MLEFLIFVLKLALLFKINNNKPGIMHLGLFFAFSCCTEPVPNRDPHRGTYRTVNSVNRYTLSVFEYVTMSNMSQMAYFAKDSSANHQN